MVEGKPNEDHSSEMRRISRSRYNRLCKIAVKEQVSIRKEKMAEAVFHNISRDAFSEVRKINTDKRSQPVNVDGKADNNDFC